MATDRFPRIRIVTLDNAYRTMDDLQARSLFSKVLALRFRGYGHEHDPYVVPADRTDFFATHIATCLEKEGGELEPISAYRMVTLGQCERHRTPFSARVIAREGESPMHQAEVERILADAGARGMDVGYCGSWTIDPSARNDRALAGFVRNLVYCTHLNWQQERRVSEMLICGVLRFKVDQFQETIGYERLRSAGDVLGSLPQRDLCGEPVAMLHLRSHSLHCRRMAAELQDYWSNRLILGAPAPETREEAA
jgi:hypothetical protein